jgi:glycosyltransferase involved in cell wall biosynthesis
MKLKIAIAGTRGIPNHYGGYEQAVTFLSEGLVKKGHAVTVYNSHHHPYKEKKWNGVEIIHCYDPEKKIGTAGQFLYDLNCIRHARKQEFDILLFMGYTSSSAWGWMFPKQSIVISNMDGLEWKRSKYSKPVRFFLKYAEKLAIRFSQYHIADSVAIKKYLDEKYGISSRFIPYGANSSPIISADNLTEFNTRQGAYYLLIARMEPENNIEMILDGYVASGSVDKFLVIGNTRNSYGKKLVQKYSANKTIHFAGALFDQQKLDNLRAFCKLYFHGHSVGGTNPSLLEAIAAGCGIAAHQNEFNEAVLGNDASYFSTPGDVSRIIRTEIPGEIKTQRKKAGMNKIKELYNWQHITDQYEMFLLQCYMTRQA